MKPSVLRRSIFRSTEKGITIVDTILASHYSLTIPLHTTFDG